MLWSSPRRHCIEGYSFEAHFLPCFCLAPWGNNLLLDYISRKLQPTCTEKSEDQRKDFTHDWPLSDHLLLMEEGMSGEESEDVQGTLISVCLDPMSGSLCRVIKDILTNPYTLARHIV